MTLTRYDSIVIGAGHNGLVCASYLAMSGQRVLVLEAGKRPGGLASLRDFHPGYQVPIAHSLGHFCAQITHDLDLHRYGFNDKSAVLDTIGLSLSSAPVLIREGVVHGVSEQDQAAYSGYMRKMSRFADALSPFWSRIIPRIGTGAAKELLTFAHMGLNLKRLGKQDMGELLRIASLPTRDLMDEQFEHETLKALLSWDGLLGSKMAPRSPNGAVLAMLYRMSGASMGGHRMHTRALIDALHQTALAVGVEVRCNSEVSRILIDESTDGQRASGVKLRSGDKIQADHVVSATDPKRTFFDLLGVRHLDIGFTNRIRRLRSDGYVAKLHLALSGVPEFTGLTGADGRMIIAPDMDSIEFAYDNAKFGECPDLPVMEVVLPSLADSSLAPTGKHVLSAHIMYVPYLLKGGWTDARRQQMCNRAVDTLVQYAPGLREQIVHQELLTPQDLQTQYRVSGGHWHHGEFAMDQMLMMRPTYDAAQYSTPIPQLFLCSAGSHPGGDIVGAAGHNAAQAILQ